MIFVFKIYYIYTNRAHTSIYCVTGDLRPNTSIHYKERPLQWQNIFYFFVLEGVLLQSNFFVEAFATELLLGEGMDVWQCSKTYPLRILEAKTIVLTHNVSIIVFWKMPPGRELNRFFIRFLEKGTENDWEIFK